MKKSSLSSSIKTWSLFTGGIILAVIVILGAFGNLKKTSFRSTVSQSGEDGAFGLMAPSMSPEFIMTDEAKLTMPSPMPPIGGGSAIRDLDGNVPEQRIIRNGNLELRVDDVDAAMIRVRSAVDAKGGVVESSSITDRGEGPRTAFITIRIPVDQFDATMSDLRGIAVLVLNESTNAQDVTLQFIDLEADLRNAKAEEQSYLRILERSGDIEDVLAVTQQLAMVRQRIERLEGQMRYTENQTDLATISLMMTEETRVQAPSRKWQPGEVIRDAIQDLVTSLQALVDLLIRAVVAIFGLLLPIGLIAWLVIWLIMKLTKKWMK